MIYDLAHGLCTLRRKADEAEGPHFPIFDRGPIFSFMLEALHLVST